MIHVPLNFRDCKANCGDLVDYDGYCPSCQRLMDGYRRCEPATRPERSAMSPQRSSSLEQIAAALILYLIAFGLQSLFEKFFAR